MLKILQFLWKCKKWDFAGTTFKSRLSWFDVVDVFPATIQCPVSSGGTTSSTGTDSNLQRQPSLGFKGLPQFYICLPGLSKALPDHCYIYHLLELYLATYNCACKVSRHYIWHNKKLKECPYTAMPRLSVKTIAFPNLIRVIYPTHILVVCW